jgi:Flp pilus assembly protein TadG
MKRSLENPAGRDGEHGAVAVMVALLLVVFVGAGAIAIDLGSAWSTKRDLVIDLDAAALAGATRLSELVTPPGSPTACPSTGAPQRTVDQVGDVVTQVATLNGNANISAVTIDCVRGTVKVEGSKAAVATFNGILRNDKLEAGGYAIGKATTITQAMVIPFTVCDKVPPLGPEPPELLGWIARPPPLGTTGTIRVGQNSSLCGPNNGNWGWFGTAQLTDPAVRIRTLSGWLENGYDGEVDLSSGCTGGAASVPGFCDASPGVTAGSLVSGQSQFTTIDSLSCAGPFPDCDVSDVYTIVIHDQTACPSGCGTNLRFKPSGFLDVVIRGAATRAGVVEIEVAFVGYRSIGPAGREVPTSYLCSVDGALADDPTCS